MNALLQVLLFGIISMGIGIALILMFTLVIAVLKIPISDQQRLPTALDPGNPLVLAALFVEALSIMLGVIILRFTRGPRLLDLGLHRAPGWRWQILLGLLLGPLIFLFIWVLEIALGWARASIGSPGIGPLLIVLLAFICVAIAEEVAFRGFILQVLERDYGLKVAVVVSSILFAIVHGNNPNFSVLAFINLFAAGLLFAYAYLKTRQLWLPIAFHLSWNYAQGPIFGFPVSGLQSQGMIDTHVTGPLLVTGGGFGPEAGLLSVFGMALGWWIIARWYRLAHVSEP